MELTYQYLVTHIVPGPKSLSYFVPLLLLLVALSIPPWILTKGQLCALFLPVITAAVVHAWTAMGCVDVISVDILLHSYFLLLFNDPRGKFRRIVARSKTRQAINGKNDFSNGHVTEPQSIISYVEQPYPRRLSERLPWVGDLLISIRLANWTIGVSSHDAQQPALPDRQTHLRFIATAILQTLTGYLVLDLTTAWTQHDPYFWTHGLSIDSPLPAPWTLVVLPPRFVRCTVLALQAWASVGQQFQLPCAIPVALHYFGLIPDTWSPHLQAPFFGRFSDIFSSNQFGAVRLFWGRYWHQTMRTYCSGPGIWLANLLNLERRGGSRYFLLAFTTFFLSGVVHMGLVPPQPLHASVSANNIRLFVAAFFWIQPIAFGIEMLVTAMLRRRQVSKGVYIALNIFWFVSWCCVALPLVGEAGRQLGYWRIWPVPLSPWRKLYRGSWKAWA